jgi:hypothetical protein
VGKGVKGIARGGLNIIKKIREKPEKVKTPPPTPPPKLFNSRPPSSSSSMSSRSYSSSSSADLIGDDYDDSEILQ